MKPHEAGATFAELVVALLITGVLILLMMPSLGIGSSYGTGGYYTNEQVNLTVQQAVADLREAQQLAMSENSVMQILYNPSDTGRGTQGYQVSQAGGSLLFKRSVPPQVDFIAGCYRGQFNPQGNYSWNPGCGTPPATVEILCFDSGTPSNPYTLQVWITIATGAVTYRQKPAGTGACP